MRIGIDIKALSNNSTGIARYLKELLDNLQQIDHQNEYVLFECRNSNYLLQNPKWKKIITVWFLPGVLWQQLILPFLLKKHAVDVLWAPEQICPVLFMSKIKIITSVHDCVEIHFPHTAQWAVKIINKFLLKRTLLKSNSIVTVSDYIKKDLYASYRSIIPSEKLHSIPNGKPNWKLPKNYDDTKRHQFLFFAGNIEPRKNLLNLIKALEHLCNKGLIIDLHIAGPQGWKNRKYFQYRSQSRVRNQIHHLGYCSQEELIRNYLTCKAFIYPSFYEGFGLPVLEALCLDSLVLTSRGTVMEEIAGPAALYFNPEDPVDIARIIELVYSPQFHRTSILKNKNAVLKKYSWESSARRLLEIIKDSSVAQKRH